jgi:hypothetical protein
MIEIIALRDHLSLGRRSLTEIATALSVSAMVGATLYNLGFFTPVEWSLISVLTVQDLLVGSTIALPPMTIAAGVALIFAHFIVNAPRRKLRTAFIIALLIIVGFVGAWYCLVGPYRSTIGHLGFSYLLLAGLAAALNLYFRSRKVALIWLGFSLAYVPFSVGVSDSLGTITSGSAAQTEIETDKTVISGRILRMTSGYAILFDGRAIDVIPLNKIRSMRRLYAKSPELDYLSSMSSSVSGS